MNHMKISPYLTSLTAEEIDNMFHTVLRYAHSGGMIGRFHRGLGLIDENYTLHQLMTSAADDPGWGSHGQVANALKWGVLFGFAKANNFDIVPIPEEIRGRAKSCRLVISEGNFIDITAVSSIFMIIEQTCVSQQHDEQAQAEQAQAEQAQAERKTREQAEQAQVERTQAALAQAEQAQEQFAQALAHAERKALAQAERAQAVSAEFAREAQNAEREAPVVQRTDAHEQIGQYIKLQYLWLMWLTVLTIMVIYNDNVVVQWLQHYVMLSYDLLAGYIILSYDLAMSHIMLFLTGFKTIVVATLQHIIDYLN